MKTLCVAVVVLSLTSVCQPASLACEKLLKPEDKSPDLSGRWHVIALSASNCLFPLLLNAFLWPSFAFDVTAKDAPNTYDANSRFNTHEQCHNESTPLLYVNNTLVFVDDSDNLPPFLLKHTGCPDCLVLKTEGDVKFLLLLSKRKNVTAEELKEFETQTECLGWTKPQMLNSDHGYETCKSLVDNIGYLDVLAIYAEIRGRLRSMQDDLNKCDPEILSNPMLKLFLD